MLMLVCASLLGNARMTRRLNDLLYIHAKRRRQNQCFRAETSGTWTSECCQRVNVTLCTPIDYDNSTDVPICRHSTRL